MRNLLRPFVLYLCLALAGTTTLTSCRHTVTIHPGAVNTFDSVTYDTLIATQATLEAASAEISKFPQLKDELNQALTGYNQAQALYKAYHAAAVAGQTQDPTDLAAAVEKVSSAAMRLLVLIQKGGK
jgi:flagellar hook-basal body complex protein FliE